VTNFYQLGRVAALTKLGVSASGAPSISGTSGASPASAAGNAQEKLMTTGIRAGVGDITKAPAPPGVMKPNPAGVEASQRSAT
jgi:hypothetical protein